MTRGRHPRIESEAYGVASERIARIFALTALLVAAGVGPGTSQAQDRGTTVISPFRMLDAFVDRCEVMNVESDTGAAEYYVYAYATMLRRREPRQGDNRQVTPVLEVCLFDSEENLTRARQQYRAVRVAFREQGGSTKYREFPFEDKSWRFDNYSGAATKVRELQRKSWMSYWPGVLNLEVTGSTGASAYYLFAFRPVDVTIHLDDDDDDVDLTFRATKRPWRIVIFDDEEAAQAARKLYDQYVETRATLTDGMGNQVGRIIPHVEKADTFAQARQRALEIRRKLEGPRAKP
ncbi:MAG: hypothetical protein JSU68_06980 [Phycisphaerales bacterium]|nr:MAG: hypothetical protein JSU68_06980 [Phycisphaerales bacterium]